VSVCTVLLDQLADARRRGERFEVVWPDALHAALRAAGARERSEWADVLGGMVDSWRAAFDRRPPSRPELALRAVGEDPERVLPCTGRECERCGEEIPPARGNGGRPPVYCSDDCRVKAGYERSRVVA
jgi:hypothetical protein